MLRRILLVLVAFVCTNALLSVLIISVGLVGTAASGLRNLPILCAIGAAWLMWKRTKQPPGVGRDAENAVSAQNQEKGPEIGLDKGPEQGRKMGRRLQPLLVFLVLVGVFGGCSSWPLPPSLSSEQRSVVNSTHIGGTVGVYRASFATQSDAIMDVAIYEIRATGLFDRVERLDHLPEPPTYRIEFRGMHWCSDTFPKPWLLLSLGIIPATEDTCGGISLRFFRGDGERYVDVNSWFKAKAIHGWAAMFFSILPDRTYGLDLPEKSGNQRFIDRLAWIIASKKSEIDQLP